MTPLGETLRLLRERKGVSQKEMAAGIGVSPAYLSALEHGRRGAPSFDLLQRIAGYFNIIWDEVDDLFRVAGLSDPRVTVDTGGLSPRHTLLANILARDIADLAPTTVEKILEILSNTDESPQNRQ
ncbi:transcriptional regulator [Rhizobium sp. RU20A]|uniref:helix-turn-helix domain-containing protein n=1 Tax=Rhizobium sp. RU20A TaxID=1907412 RepID=UPI000954D8E7|nr:helix-turn-helix transcriptional regulator [Rhizobium sp. RU20A]SIQ84231.1 transcriptional regulator [Rhizobium sp. RU20A]